MQQIQFQLGSDPELFIRDRDSKELRSAIPVIPEGKGEGRPLDASGQNAVLHDNVLVEFNTKPAQSKDEFVQTIGEVLKKIQNIVGEQGMELHLQASTNFPAELLCEEARIFGCDPDFGSYPPGMNVMPAEAATQPFRSAGGHLHIGMHDDSPELTELLSEESGLGKIRAVKGLDVFIGLIGVFLDKDPTSAARRSLYGKAGAHRPKTYGVEYRACSPWWLTTPEHTALVHTLTNAALSVVLEEEDLEDIIDDLGGEEELQAIINESKTDKARAVYEQYLVPHLDEETTKLIQELDLREEKDFREAWDL